MKATLFSLTALLVPLVASAPALKVDLHITDDGNPQASSRHLQQALKPDGSVGAQSEQIPGWLFVDGTTFRSRVHGNTFWNIKGTLAEKFPLEDFLFDPVLLTLSHPDNFSGPFNGTIGRGQVDLSWDKGATLTGRSPIGDFSISGETVVDYSP